MKIIRCADYRWQGVELRSYKSEGTHFRDISRQTLLGEAEEETALNCITRYFEIQPGGYSSLEKHQHPHSVLVIRGRGTVLLGESANSIETLDCVYIAPGTLHQFHASSDQVLGFICIVDRQRDRPELASREELARLRSIEDLREFIKV